MGLKVGGGLNKCYLRVKGTQGLVHVSHAFLGEVSFLGKTCTRHPGLQRFPCGLWQAWNRHRLGWLRRRWMVFTALQTNHIPEALTGVLCFIFNSRHGMLVLHLHVLGEEVSKASNEATMALVVTQPIPELGEDLAGPCSTSAHTPPRELCVPLVQSCSKPKCMHLKLKHQLPLKQDMFLGLLLSSLSPALVAVCHGSWECSARDVSWDLWCSSCAQMLLSSSASSPGLASCLRVGPPVMSTEQAVASLNVL